MFIFFLQVKLFLKTSVTQRNVSLVHNVKACTAWRHRALTPMTLLACATMASTLMISRRSVNPALNVQKVGACCTAVSLTVIPCVRSASGTLTQTRKVLESPASRAPPVMMKGCYRPAPLSVIRFVKVRQSAYFHGRTKVFLHLLSS